MFAAQTDVVPLRRLFTVDAICRAAVGIKRLPHSFLCSTFSSIELSIPDVRRPPERLFLHQSRSFPDRP